MHGALDVQMVQGPAIVKVVGKCRVLGMDASFRTIEVRAGKMLPFEPSANCKLEVQGEWWYAPPADTGTSMWESIVSNILTVTKDRKGTTVAMVIGATDTGKSTFSTYLANSALERQILPCIIDGDIGQGDLAPPGALGAVVLKEQVADLRNLNADMLAFVGTISPAGTQALLQRELQLLVGRMRRTIASVPNCLVIINTDGYVKPSFKQRIAKSISPEILIYMDKCENSNNTSNSQYNREGETLLSALSGQPWSLIVAPSSSHASKTYSERVVRRLEQYARFLGTRDVSKFVDAVRFRYLGRSVGECEISTIVRTGMFVALGRGKHFVIGFGRVEAFDGQKILVRTKCDDNFSVIHGSEIFLR